jgi:hypothetical protein
MVFLALWLIPQLSFAGTAIEARVDKTAVTTDDVITYTVSVTSSEKVIPDPQLPDFAHFAVISQEQSSSFSFGTGGVASKSAFIYYLAPRQPGSFVIAAAQIKIKDKVIMSDAFTIEVKAGKARIPDDPDRTQAVPSQQDLFTPAEEQVTL